MRLAEVREKLLARGILQPSVVIGLTAGKDLNLKSVSVWQPLAFRYHQSLA